MSNFHDKPPPYTEFVNQPENAYSPPQPLFNPTGIPNYGSTVMVQPVSTQVIIVGGCPACRVGILEDDFTCLGYFLAIACFPIGLLCCYAMRQRRCPNCGAVFE